VIRLLAEAGQSGALHVSDGTFSGDIFLEAGRIIGAVAGSDTGTKALELLALVVGNCQFEFTDDGSPRELNLILEPDRLRADLDRLEAERAELAEHLPSVLAVPHLTLADSTTAQVTLTTAALRLLVAMDGRTVLQLADDRGLVQTLRDVAELTRLRLVKCEPLGEDVDEDAAQLRAFISRPRQEPGPDAQIGTRGEHQRTAWPRWRATRPEAPANSTE